MSEEDLYTAEKAREALKWMSTCREYLKTLQ